MVEQLRRTNSYATFQLKHVKIVFSERQAPYCHGHNGGWLVTVTVCENEMVLVVFRLFTDFLTDCREWLTWLDEIKWLDGTSFFHVRGTSFHNYSPLLTFRLQVSSSVSPSAHLEFFFQEQSYSSLYSGRSLAWDHVRGDIDDSCGAIANFCGVVADFCGVVADPCGAFAIGET